MGTSGKRNYYCPSSRWSGHNILWQLVPVRDYSNAERMLAATSLTPLLVNLQSLTSKTNAGGGQQRLRHMESQGGRA